MILCSIIGIFGVLVLAPVIAQNVPAPLVSPVVNKDSSVTFSLLAPRATEVKLNGDWPKGKNVDMTRDDKGVWSVTVGPLEPELWQYTFSVDGVRMLDLMNANVVRDGLFFLDTVLIPGPESSDYQINDIPHGTLSIVWFPSPTLSMSRRMYVYTPAGYEKGTSRYPVLYLLHGLTGDEDAWTTLAKVPQIMDSVTSKDKVKPMIVVMPNANAQQPAAQNMVPLTPDLTGFPGMTVSMVRFPASLVKDIVPFVDKTYRTIARRESRAIAGLSMGGALAVQIGLNNLDSFAWVGSFSGAFIAWPSSIVPSAAGGPPRLDLTGVEKTFPNLVGSKTKSTFLYLSCGLDDGLLSSNRQLKDWLKSRGVGFVDVETPGYAHVWSFWRVSLKDYASRLFR